MKNKFIYFFNSQHLCCCSLQPLMIVLLLWLKETLHKLKRELDAARCKWLVRCIVGKMHGSCAHRCLWEASGCIHKDSLSKGKLASWAVFTMEKNSLLSEYRSFKMYHGYWCLYNTQWIVTSMLRKHIVSFFLIFNVSFLFIISNFHKVY